MAVRISLGKITFHCSNTRVLNIIADHEEFKEEKAIAHKFTASIYIPYTQFKNKSTHVTWNWLELVFLLFIHPI